MNAREAAALIGSMGTFEPVKGFKVRVLILDVRNAFGRTDVQVRAAGGGEGDTWVSLSRVSLDIFTPGGAQ